MAAFADQPFPVFPNLWEEPAKPRNINSSGISTKSSMSGSGDVEEWKPSKQVWAIIAGQCCCIFVVCLDATIFSASLPTVAGALHADAVSAYYAVLQPVAAALADIFGRRSTFLSSLSIFTAGTVVCCTAQGATQMLVGRTVQGLGASGIFSVNLIILSDILPLRQRSKYVGIVQLVASFATTFAPIVGATLINVSWRWLFYINFPFCVVSLAIVPFLLRYVEAESTLYKKLGSIDWIGSVISIIGATSFLLGLSWGGNSYAWNSAATLVPLILGTLLICACIAYEHCVARNPFLRFSCFGSRSAIVAYTCTVLASLTLFAEIYFISLFFLTVELYTPVASFALFLAIATAVVPVSGVTGALITSIGSYKWAVFSGWIINTFGLGALMILGPGSYVPGVIFLLIVGGIGAGMLFMAHQVAVQASCPPEDVAYASAIFSFCRSFGFCLGVALGGTAFQNFLRQELFDRGLPIAIAADAEGYASILKHMAAGATTTEIINAYSFAFRYLWATMMGISALGFALSFMVGEHTLDVQLAATHKLQSKDMLPIEHEPVQAREKRSSRSSSC
ncbi:hypothetical protein B0A55_10209 [Friedmanniomyces simplex]|uniref:Major facilitator superfamily (MFS) profile domain-containing protein n=1 Tax=Friedmanniomyces simplex TaxID=329884 RepID=A0A4U0WKI7_9PEZI|nr:hypothetical protein B0A55_10209 [Friedmanniomyces simplex]